MEPLQIDEPGRKVLLMGNEAIARGAIESGITALRETLKGDEKDAIERAMKSLEEASHKVAQQMYEAAGAEQGAAGCGAEAPPQGDAPAGGKDDDDVIDAEFEVKE